MAKNVQIIETGKGYTLTTTNVPETSAELSAHTGIRKESIRAHMETMGAHFDAEGHIYFDLEISAELALSIFDGVEVKEVEEITPDDPVLSEHPEDDVPEAEETEQEKEPVIETEAVPEPVTETNVTENVVDMVPAKPDVKVSVIMSPDFMSYTITTTADRETTKVIAEKASLSKVDLLADIYLCNGKVDSDDYISFDSEEDAEKAAGKINRLIAEAPTKKVEEVCDEESEPEVQAETPVKKEEEVIPDFSDYREKLQWELDKIKKAHCKDEDNPSMNEMNFLGSFMWYMSCIDQRVAVDPSFESKVLDKRLNLDLLNKFLMMRALGQLSPTDDGNIVTKEAAEAEKNKKKGVNSSSGDLSRFTMNMGEFLDNTYGASRGIGYHVPDADVAGWIFDFYDHEGEALYNKIKRKKEKKVKEAEERKKKAEKNKTTKKSKAKSSKAIVKPVTTETQTEKAEVRTETTVTEETPESTDIPLTPSEIWGMDDPYKINGNGYAQMNFMSMLT